jgi:hypothetical protein
LDGDAEPVATHREGWPHAQGGRGSDGGGGTWEPAATKSQRSSRCSRSVGFQVVRWAWQVQAPTSSDCGTPPGRSCSAPRASRRTRRLVAHRIRELGWMGQYTSACGCRSWAGTLPRAGGPYGAAPGSSAAPSARHPPQRQRPAGGSRPAEISCETSGGSCAGAAQAPRHTGQVRDPNRVAKQLLTAAPGLSPPNTTRWERARRNPGRWEEHPRGRRCPHVGQVNNVRSPPWRLAAEPASGSGRSAGAAAVATGGTAVDAASSAPAWDASGSRQTGQASAGEGGAARVASASASSSSRPARMASSTSRRSACSLHLPGAGPGVGPGPGPGVGFSCAGSL